MTYCANCGAKFEGPGYLCPDCLNDMYDESEKEKHEDQNRSNKNKWYGRTNTRKEKYDE